MPSASSFSSLRRRGIRSIARIFQWPGIAFAAALVLLSSPKAFAQDTPRAVIAKAVILDESEEQARLINSLSGNPAPDLVSLINGWKVGAILIWEAPADVAGIPEGTRFAITLGPEKDAEDRQPAIRFADQTPLKDGNGAPIRVLASDVSSAETDSNLRMAMKGVLDLANLNSPDTLTRFHASQMLGMEQDPERIPVLKDRLAKETDRKIARALREGIALTLLKDPDPAVQIAACNTLGTMGSIPSRDFLKQVIRDNPDKPEVINAANKALDAIADHLIVVDTAGTLFRGISLGSILLVVAIGLAVTFGLMGVINMAHGELIVVGAYTTYVIQNIFSTGLALSIALPINFGGSPIVIPINLPGLNLVGESLDFYFIVALPASFLVAALVGIALERTIIRFLYRRPLESLLATWGVSLILQNLFRIVFGANNVQVYSPSFLSGNWTIYDIQFTWARVFIIGFAILIIWGTHAALTKTSLGLLIRAVMQNRSMAACMGVRTERVNMLTFAFGSGLAGLAGAFLSQIDNTGPGLGQNYIVNAFMTVVVGGVGSIFGTVISALGIGLIDQSLQQLLDSPVLGKILVLVGIILFLQWRPAGIFVTKSRSLES